MPIAENHILNFRDCVLVHSLESFGFLSKLFAFQGSHQHVRILALAVSPPQQNKKLMLSQQVLWWGQQSSRTFGRAGLKYGQSSGHLAMKPAQLNTLCKSRDKLLFLPCQGKIYVYFLSFLDSELKLINVVLKHLHCITFLDLHRISFQTRKTWIRIFFRKRKVCYL